MNDLIVPDYSKFRCPNCAQPPEKPAIVVGCNLAKNLSSEKVEEVCVKHAKEHLLKEEWFDFGYTRIWSPAVCNACDHRIILSIPGSLMSQKYFLSSDKQFIDLRETHRCSSCGKKYSILIRV